MAYIAKIAEGTKRAAACAVDNVISNSESICSRVGKCLLNFF